jgi:Arc/MetJ-type ribon-helix-helix transcriptional regulator
MQIQLSKRAAEFVSQLLAEGEFASADEVVERALDFYAHQRPTMESLKQKIAEAIDDVEKFGDQPWDVEEVKQALAERIKANSAKPGH